MPEQYPSMFDVQKVDLSVIKDILVRTNSLEALKELEKEINQPELIDIDEAYRLAQYLYREAQAEKLPAKATIQAWISEGRLQQRGYLQTKKSVGRPKVLISKIDLLELLNNPPKIGRPVGSDKGADSSKGNLVRKKTPKAETLNLFDL
ncbi:MAG: hypothetical protein NZ820_00180 [Dehalococcoidia bacterium]|jgi:hypothetical protein|uniref:Uncharacterized protein n=1 Tax=marine metagenome TaxID=408172 RepID=A0A381U0J5_9ZZZZ|nr:hypothetical protein [Dehalococcoidia bacterium]MEC7914580.1 hypothetical protein [Chloroflexota bacterium]MCS5647751.1 hypothetical protein [Dehalococcoidia bacterium]HAT22000.1 hypothetical protein [Dehalococcoidia bacterium]HBF00066.1 hypothetical protein [Dehalococcoidia bacterium]|tara:strand:- start:229 stop:675 length:447 start_codon:yes stop_codon:yes gene_type:complete